MPELPEVEIVRQSLDKKIRQKKVKKVIIRNQNLRIKVPNYFKRFLENKIIIKVKRFSKYFQVFSSFPLVFRCWMSLRFSISLRFSVCLRCSMFEVPSMLDFP